MNFKKLKFNCGFNLIETLIGVSIFSTALVSILVVLGSGTSSINFVKNKTTAMYLAQEGIELTRNARDTKIIESFSDTQIQNSGWDGFKLYATECEDGCTIQIDTDKNIKLEKCGTGGVAGANENNSETDCKQLIYNRDTEEYGYQQDQKTNETLFNRKIYILDTEKNNEKRNIESGVSFKVNPSISQQEKEIIFTEDLFNWQ